jgi:hypothetical protein
MGIALGGVGFVLWESSFVSSSSTGGDVLLRSFSSSYSRKDLVVNFFNLFLSSVGATKELHIFFFSSYKAYRKKLVF